MMTLRLSDESDFLRRVLKCEKVRAALNQRAGIPSIAAPLENPGRERFSEMKTTMICFGQLAPSSMSS